MKIMSAGGIMVRASLVIGLSSFLALSTGYTQTDDSADDEPSKMI
jgi:hypothetical protein